MTRLVTNEHAAKIAANTSDAYSYASYGPVGWKACATMLARKGYSAKEIEAILRSKWTRWAGDHSKNRYGYRTSKDLERFMKGTCEEELRELVEGTFGIENRL